MLTGTRRSKRQAKLRAQHNNMAEQSILDSLLLDNSYSRDSQEVATETKRSKDGESETSESDPDELFTPPGTKTSQSTTDGQEGVATLASLVNEVEQESTNFEDMVQGKLSIPNSHSTRQGHISQHNTPGQ